MRHVTNNKSFGRELALAKNDTKDDDDDGDDAAGQKDANVDTVATWNRVERNYSIYLVLHRYWSMQSVNSYLVVERDRRKRTADYRNDILPPPIVRPTLRIYYAIDVSSLARLHVAVLAVNKTVSPHRRPISPPSSTATSRLFLYDAFSAATDVFERVTVLRRTIVDAFDAWNRALDNVVHFQYVPFTRRLRDSPYSDRVIVVSVNNLTHVNEHTGLDEEFTSPLTLAHAYINFLHVNGETTQFFVAPHSQRSLLQVAAAGRKPDRRHATATVTSTVDRETAKSLLGYESMYEMNKDIESITQRTVLIKYPYHTCLFCTLLHEIGHILGLGHTTSRDSVMLDVIDSYDQKISLTDVQAMRKLFAPLNGKIRSLERKIAETSCRSVKSARPAEARRRRRRTTILRRRSSSRKHRNSSL